MKYPNKEITEKYNAVPNTDSANLAPLPGMHGIVPLGPEPYNHNFPEPVSTQIVDERGHTHSTPQIRLQVLSNIRK
eukprot:3488685-Lingulodinium_polyedra.AAC.1